MAQSGIGIDISEGALRGAEILQKHLKVSDEKCSFLNKDFYSFVENRGGSSNNEFSLVLSIQFLNYISDLDIFFKDCHRLLKNGGILVVSDGQKSPPVSMLNALKKNAVLRRLFGKRILTAEDPDLIFHQQKDILRKAKSFGFELERVRYGFFSTFTLFGFYLYRWSLLEFESRFQRTVFRMVYVALRNLVILEDILRQFSPKGRLYFMVLRKVEVTPS